MDILVYLQGEHLLGIGLIARYDYLYMISSGILHVDIERIIEEEKQLHNHRISSFRQTGTLFEGGRVVDFIYSFEKPDKFRAEVKIDTELVYVEGYNGEKAWEMDQYLIGEPAIALENSAQWPNPLVSLKKFRDEGNAIRFIDTVIDDDKEFYQLRLSLQDNTTRDYFLSVNDFVPIYVEEKRKLEPGGEPKGVETFFDDYRKVEGIPFPFHEVERIKGEEEALMDIQWIHVTLDPVLEDGHFDKLRY